MCSSGEDIKVEIVSFFFFYETLYFFIRNMVTFDQVNTTTYRDLFGVAECHKLDPKMNVNW